MTRGAKLFRRLCTTICLTVLVSSSVSCAYRYAGEDAPDRHYRERQQDDASVVKLEQPEQGSSPVKTSNEQRAKSPESPCGIDTFELHRFDTEKRVTRTVDCRTKEVLKVERNPLGQTQLDALRGRGHPEQSWYLLVDPEGLRSNYVNNVELMKMRQQFALEFEGKDRREDLMIYTLTETLE
jgi:hypothetical protein